MLVDPNQLQVRSEALGRDPRPQFRLMACELQFSYRKINEY